MASEEPRRRILSLPTVWQSIGAGVFWAASLRPSLLPRDWYIQAAISGISAAVGAGVGALVAWIGRLVTRRPRSQAGRGEGIVAIIVTALGLLALVPWQSWQADQRALVAQPPETVLAVLPLVVVALVVFTILFLLGRIVGHGLFHVDRWLHRFMPRWVAFGLTAVLFTVGVYVLSNEFAFRRFVNWANARYSAFDRSTQGMTRPTSPYVSGGPGSLAPWRSLGEEGRNFVGGATSEEELRAFDSGREAMPPIRVYAGLRSAPSVKERADLVVRELDRTGAAQRSLLIVTTSTGTGWVDPVAAASVEYMQGGDTAIASMQYSYLPSWISFLVDGGKAADAGKALNDAVFKWWSGLSPQSRPELVIFGESLGSMGTESAFAQDSAASSVAALTSNSDGVLLVGPTASNAIWGQIEGARDSSSPVWAPVFEGGRTVRSMPAAGDVRPAGGTWEAPRILYVHHPSDPVGNFTMSTLWWPPAWTQSPTGDDVPSTVGWFPVVTWVQVVADLAAGFSSEPGHGHNYDSDFIAAWEQIVPPSGWTHEDTVRLQRILSSLSGSSS